MKSKKNQQPDVFRRLYGHRSVRLTKVKDQAPLVIVIAFEAMDQPLLEECRKQQTKEFNLLTISSLHWDEELSPWPSRPIVMKDDHFTGEANALLSLIEKEILPWTYTCLETKPDSVILCGYSMGGLFSLYSMYNSVSFDKCGCISGSVWYPNFHEYCLSHKFRRKPQAIYFSLGDKETKVSNPYLQRTGLIMDNLAFLYEKEGIESTFVWNQGNHFVDALYRMAIGIRWLLNH